MLEALGETKTHRVSHVEPGSGLSPEALQSLTVCTMYWEGQLIIQQAYENCWFADLTPTGHDVVLGPYGPEERDGALAAEIRWLREHNLPAPE